MRREFAAAYLDSTLEQFDAGVDSGKYPQPVVDGRRKYWYREDLDSAADRLKGAVPSSDYVMAMIEGQSCRSSG